MTDQLVSRQRPLLACILTCLMTAWPMQALSQSDSLDHQSADWSQANQQVGKFLRGHIDILRAEARAASGSSGSDRADAVSSNGPELTLELARQMALQARPSLFTVGALSPLEQSVQIANVTELLADVERAWVQAIGTQMLLKHQENATEAARIGYELAQRMGKVGNWGLDRVVAAGLQAQSEELRRLQSIEQAAQARQALISWVMTEDFRLPSALPAIGGIGARHDLRTSPEQLAIDRLNLMPDYASSRATLDRARSAAGNGAIEQWKNYAQSRIESVARGERPLSLAVEPGSVLWTHAIQEALQQEQAIALREESTRATIARAQTEVKFLHAQVMLLGNEMLPLARQAEEEAVFQYNGMFISTWSLLDQYRSRVSAEIDYVRAQMDYWDAVYAYQAYLAGAPYKASASGRAAIGGSAGAAGTGGGH